MILDYSQYNKYKGEDGIVNFEYVNNGHLSALEKIGCSCIIEIVHKKWFWKREKFWKDNYASDVMELVVNPIEKKIEKLRRCNE